MKKNMALFAFLIIGLGTVASVYPGRGRRGGHRGGHHRGWGGIGGYGGYGGRPLGVGITFGSGRYYGRPYGPYGRYGYRPRTVIIDSEQDNHRKPARYQDRSGYQFWQVTNNTGDGINVTSRTDAVSIQPGQTRTVNRGRSFNLSINGKRFSPSSHDIEVITTDSGRLTIRTSN